MVNRKTLAIISCAALFVAGGMAAFILGRERYAQSLAAGALAHLENGENAEALADLDKLIELKPGDALARLMRAQARMSLEDYAGALEDANRACEIQPDTPVADGYITARHFRAVIRSRNGDLPGAIADATQVLELNPRNREVTMLRAALLHDMGDSAAALAEIDKLEATGAFTPFWSINRGRARRALGDYEAASEDFRTAMNYGEPFAGIWLALTMRAQGLPLNGLPPYQHDPFRDPSAGPNAYDWEEALYNHVTDRMTEAELFALVPAAPDAFKQRGRACEAWFYSGMLKLQAGDKTTAAEYFRRSMETGRKDFIEYWESARALREMENAPVKDDSPATPVIAAPAAP